MVDILQVSLVLEVDLYLQYCIVVIFITEERNGAFCLVLIMKLFSTALSYLTVHFPRTFLYF